MKFTSMHLVLFGTNKNVGKHQTTVCWVAIKLAQKKVSQMYQSRRAQHMSNAWKKKLRRDVFGRCWSCNSKRIDIQSNRIECNHTSKETSPAHCIPKVNRLKVAEVFHEKADMSDPRQKFRHVTIKQKKWIWKLIVNQKGKFLDNWRRSCSTSKILPSNFFNSNSNSREIRTIWHYARRDSSSRWQKNVSFASRKTWSVFKHVHLMAAQCWANAW